MDASAATSASYNGSHYEWKEETGQNGDSVFNRIQVLYQKVKIGQQACAWQHDSNQLDNFRNVQLWAGPRKGK